jgi:hypothetical protein
MADHHLVAFGLEQPRISRGVVPQWCRIKFRCCGITIRERIYQSKNIPCADMPEDLVYTPGIRRTTLSQCHGNRRNESHTRAADPSTTTRSFVSAEPEGPNPSARMAEIVNDRWLEAHLVDDSRLCATLGWLTRPTTTRPSALIRRQRLFDPVVPLQSPYPSHHQSPTYHAYVQPFSIHGHGIILIGTSTLPRLQPFQQNTHEYSNLRHPTRLNQHHSLKSFWRSPNVKLRHQSFFGVH